jgi:FAD/FMN-containing dehydrogenase
MKRRRFLQAGITAVAGLTLPTRPFDLSASPIPRGWASAHNTREDLLAVTGDGDEVVIAADAVRALARELRGRLLLRDEAGYDDARRILNPAFDRYPALIAQVTGAVDVQTAVRFARAHGGLLLAVKCGGHSFSGQSTCDRGMMIDLSPFRHVRVDASRRRAWVSGGSLLGAVDHETMAHGLVTPLGTVSHTGAGGLVTGGGFGRLSRRFGLSIDNLESVDVVTADGVLVHADSREHPDLFWGVRGGGGNFGVVTSFEFQLHPMQREVVAGRLIFPFDKGREALELYAEYAFEAPDELQVDMAVMVPPPEQAPPGAEAGLTGFEVCYSGDPREAERALAPLRRLGTPLMDTVETRDYVEVQRSGDIEDPRARASYLYGGFVPEIPPDLITTIVEGLERHPHRGGGVVLIQCGGAISRVPSDATAFAQRDAIANMLCSVNWSHDGSDPGEHIDWIRGYWPSLERFTHGFYVNDANPDQLGQSIQANYRRNHDRLVQVKNRYDPGNLFRLNANIQPMVEAGAS